MALKIRVYLLMCSVEGFGFQGFLGLMGSIKRTNYKVCRHNFIPGDVLASHAP